jgi:5-methylcytosine-specific restriction endonuclease McrA
MPRWPNTGDRARALAAGKRAYFTGIPCKHGHVCDRHSTNGACVECHNGRRRQGKMDPRSRASAMMAGERYYFTGLPCVNGHVARRTTLNGACTECVKARYQNYFALNYEKLRAQNKDYYWKNRTARLEQKKQYVRRPEIRQARSAYSLAYYYKHPERWARYEPRDIEWLMQKQRGKCVECGAALKGKFEVDHIMPCKLGGTTVRQNLQLLCVSCNRRKSAKHPIDWAQLRGRLL